MAHGIAEVLELGRARGVQGTLRGFMLQAELCALVLNGCGSWPKEPTVYVEWRGQKVRGTNSSGSLRRYSLPCYVGERNGGENKAGRSWVLCGTKESDQRCKTAQSCCRQFVHV